MWFSSWLRNEKRSAPTARRRTPTSPRQRAAFRPRLEALEARCVPSTLTVTNVGDSGHGSLRYEIAQAEQSNATDTIVFNLKPNDPGYKSTGHWTITLTSGELDITRSLNIQGPGAGQLVISPRVEYIAAVGNFAGVSRVFEVAAGAQVNLSGMSIENGGANGNGIDIASAEGGGILNHGVLTVSNCHLFGNSAYYAGGGIYNDGTLTVSGSDFGGNIASDDRGPDPWGPPGLRRRHLQRRDADGPRQHLLQRQQPGQHRGRLHRRRWQHVLQLTTRAAAKASREIGGKSVSVHLLLFSNK
jgi:hypothetical protein